MNNFVFLFVSGDGAKKVKALKSFLLLLFVLPVLSHSQIKIYNPGQAFTSIATDKNGNIWAGTQKNGLWKCRRVDIPEPNTLEEFFTKFSVDENFDKVNIQTIAIDQTANVWVGHNGLGGGSAPGGGIHLFNSIDRSPYKHYTPYSQINKLKNDGLPSRNSKAVAVDKNGTVWTAHGYHDLFVPSAVDPYIDPWGNVYPGIPASYIVTCGGIAYKKANAITFDTIDTKAAGVPYGAYTVNTPFDKNAGTRQCISIAAGPSEVWAGVGLYESIEGFVGSRILRFNLDGSFKGYFDEKNSVLPLSATRTTRANTIHFQSNGNAWVGFSIRRGLAVYKNEKWTYVEKLLNKEAVSQLLPGGIVFDNYPNLIASKGSKVFLGTIGGLLIYKGKGDYAQDSSYQLLTTAQGLPSNNIRSVATDEESVWVATDKGIARIPINANLSIYHLNGYPLDPLTTTKRTLLNSIEDGVTDDVATYIAADSSKATVFLYKAPNSANLKFSIKENTDENSENNKAEFGSFTVLTRHADSLKVHYQHPRFLPTAFLEKESNGREVTLLVTDTTTDIVVLETKIKYVLPPVLLVHGVWTDISSLTSMQKYLTENKEGYRYFDFQVLRKYRLRGQDAEKPFSKDAREVPDGIAELIANCAGSNLSAGKVNIVAHSRGGLYTRAYMEELEPGIPYRRDINSLITLNTPHAGSQLANLVTDIRKILPLGPNLGNLFSGLVPSKGDRNEKNGAKVLLVNKGFIEDLNANFRLEAVKKYKVPVHAFATNFEACKLLPGLCHDLPKPVLIAGKFAAAVRIYFFLTKELPEGIDGLLKIVFNGEKSDVIVPRSSMIAGLEDHYVSFMEGENIPHCNLPFIKLLDVGITESAKAHKRINALLGQNLYDGKSNFTTEGFNPPRGEKRLRYNFLPALSKINANPPPEHRNMQPADNTGTISIDAAIKGKEYKANDTLRVPIHSSGTKKMLMVYEMEGAEDDNHIYSDIRIAIDQPVFEFPIPADFYGKVNLTVFGFDDSTLVAMDTSHIQIGIPGNVHLVKLMIDGESEVSIRENDVYPFVIKGLYSDSVVRNLTYSDSVRYVIRDSNLISRVGYGEIQGRLTGMTNLIAVWGKKADSIGIKVLVNPFKNQTLLDYFTANSDSSGHRRLQWLSLQEYQNAFFVIERSIDRTHFDSIGMVKGNGTKTSPSTYDYTDESKVTAPIYYRLTLVDSSGKESYSRIITISVNTATSPLPVKLLTFTGRLVENKIKLRWTTATEVNNKQFVIEASDDGMFFTEIGMVNGKGNSSVPVDYAFDDSRLLKNGKHYYRLKQYDLDGKFIYSSVVLVQVNGEGFYSISLYPNPAQKRILLNFSQPLVNNLQLELMDIHGRRLLSKTLTVNSTLVPIDLPLLTAGMYLITISNERGEKLLANKLIIQQ